MEMTDDGSDAPMTVAQATDTQKMPNEIDRSLRLRTIVMDNFKNYIGQHTIEIDCEAFTCFFGRNGAGKSCVVDAIAFCLGATPQQLRVKRFAKLVNDVVAADDPSASASVTLCFQVEEETVLWIKRSVDVSTSQSKFYYSDAPTPAWKVQCVFLTRRYLRGDLTEFVLYIQTASKATVESCLRQYGVDLQLQDRFIIRQANASALAQMSSLQLLHFCERIIGTSHLKDELTDLHRQWNDIATQNETYRALITALDKEADQHQPMVTKYQNWIEKTEKMEIATTDTRKSLGDINHRLVRLHRNKLSELQESRSQYQEEAAHFRMEIEEKEEKLSERAKIVEAQHDQVLHAMQHLRRATKTKARLSSQLETIRSDQNAIKIRLAHFEQEKAGNAQALTKLEEQSACDAQAETELQEKTKTVAEAIAALTGSTQDDAESEHSTHEIIKQIEQLETMLRDAKSSQIVQKKSKTQAQKALASAQAALAEQSRFMAEKQTAFDGLDVAQKEDMRTLLGLKASETTLHAEVAALEADLAHQNRRVSKLASRSKGDQAIQRLRESLGPNAVLGRLWELAVTTTEFEEAVNSALQAHLLHVVVQDRGSALSVSRTFSDETIGRVSCCVLDEFDASLQCSMAVCGAGREDQGVSDGPVPLCRALVCADDRARRMFHKYAHKWVVCRHTDEATLLVRRGDKNCVTLQGDIFYTDGSIRASRRSSNHPQASRIRSSDASTTEGTGACQQPGGNRSELLGPSLSVTLSQTQARQKELGLQVRQVTKRIDSNQQEIEQLSIQLLEGSSAIRQLEAIVQAAQCELDRASSTDLDQVAAHVDDCTKKLANLKRERSRLTKSSALKKRATLLSQKAKLERELSILRGRVSLNKSSITKLLAKDQALSQQLAASTEKVARLDQNAEAMQDRVEQAGTDVVATEQDAKRLKDALSAEKDAQKTLASEQRHLEDDLRKKRSEIKRLIDEEDQIAAKISALENEIVSSHLTKDHYDDPMEDTPIDQLEREREQHINVLEELDDEQRVLDSIKSTISVEAIERAVACENELASLQDQLEHSKKSLTALTSRQHEVTMTRYERLAEALRTVNTNFSRIYRLMNEDGDCYLGYSSEKSTLFAEGVTLNCKPDEGHWQPFIGLSGGQQVVCAVSLMLALQASFPSPFYVCDEIDAALDTVNVKKLAELLRDQSRQSNTQFLIVSHRPEMWEVGIATPARESRLITMMDLNPANPFGDLMSKAVKLKGHQQAQLRTKFDSWPQYFQHSMFMQESVTSVRVKPFPERIEAAESMKKAGNNHFGNGDLEEAVAEYEKALSVFKFAENMDPGWKKKGIEDKDIKVTDYTCENREDQARLDALKVSCYLNLAVCKFKLREYQLCIRACDDTLEIEPRNVKALYRRAQALITPASSGALEFDQALVNLQTAYEIDPENREVRKMYRELRELKAKQRQIDKATFTGMFNRGHVYDANEMRSEEQVETSGDSQEARDKKFEAEVQEAENLARMCAAKGQTKHAEEILAKIAAAKQARSRRRKQVDFFHPTAEMIEDAKKEGIDLTDPQVQAMLQQLQEDEKRKEEDPSYQPPDRSAPSASDFDSIDAMLKSMTNTQIADMLRREGVDYHKITDRDQFLETARQVLATKLASTKTESSSSKSNSYFWTVFVFAIAWTMLRLYSTGGLATFARAITNVVSGRDGALAHPSRHDTDDFFDD